MVCNPGEMGVSYFSQSKGERDGKGKDAGPEIRLNDAPGKDVV